jgi:C4-dicarboxylate-specific signal transduction histidine kinase
MNASDLTPMGHGLAGLSHDLKNVLAILGESAGLIDDLVRQDPASTPVAAMGRAFDRIERQLDRADAMAARLSRFAHTFDDPEASQPLSHIVDQAVFLTDRRARTRPVTVSVSLSHEPDLVRPVEFLLRLAALLESAVDTIPPGSRLCLTSEEGRILLSAETADAPGPPAGRLPATDAGTTSVDLSGGGVVAIDLP